MRTLNGQQPQLHAFSKEDSYRNLDRVNYFIANADSKASFVLALIGVFITVFFTSGVVDSSLESLIKLALKLKTADFKGVAVVLTTIVLIIFGYLFARGALEIISALTANVKKSSPIANSNLFFGSIAKMDFNDYVQALNSLTEHDLQMDIDSQTFVNATICSEKFRRYGQGIKHLKLALLFFLVLMVLLYVIRQISSP